MTCGHQVHAPMMEDASSSTSEQLRARAVEFSDVLEYIPRPLSTISSETSIPPTTSTDSDAGSDAGPAIW